jgi:hypothetical protein
MKISLAPRMTDSGGVGSHRGLVNSRLVLMTGSPPVVAEPSAAMAATVVAIIQKLVFSANNYLC